MDKENTICSKDTLSRNLLELIAISGEFPQKDLHRIAGGKSYKGSVVGTLKREGLIKTYYRYSAAVLLAEYFIQHGNGNKSAVYKLTEYIASAHALQLIGVAYKNNLCIITDSHKKLPRKPHIYHGAFVHNNKSGADRLKFLILFQISVLVLKSQHTVKR